MSRSALDRFGDEVIRHGGLPMRRRDIHELTLLETGDERCADYFAFRPHAEVLDPARCGHVYGPGEALTVHTPSDAAGTVSRVR